MAGWLRNRNDDGIRLRDDIGDVMPASVRGPEGHRFDRPEEEADADIAFVAGLARAVDNETARRQARLGTSDEAAEGALDLFREYSAARRVDVRPALRFNVGHVNLTDLVEDLELTAALLRNRKAA